MVATTGKYNLKVALLHLSHQGFLDVHDSMRLLYGSSAQPESCIAPLPAQLGKSSTAMVDFLPESCFVTLQAALDSMVRCNSPSGKLLCTSADVGTHDDYEFYSSAFRQIMMYLDSR